MKSYKVKGAWRSQSAGGCFNVPTWRFNPQLFLKQDRNQTVKITLYQEADPCFHIGFYICQGDGSGRRQLEMSPDRLLAKTPFENAPDVSLSVELQADMEYVIIPCTFKSGDQTSFTMTFESENDLHLSVLSEQNEWIFCKSEGSWTGTLAGGCRNHQTFLNNPQFLLQLDVPSMVGILLGQTLKEDFDCIGFYVISTTGDYRMSSTRSANIVGKSEFSRSNEAFSSFFLQPGNYIIVPCTFDPCHESKFFLNLFSNNDLSLYELQLASSEDITIEGEWKGKTAGGCVNFYSWRNNPQYLIHPQETCKVKIALQQARCAQFESIGFYVVTNEGGRRVVLIDQDSIVTKAAFAPQHEVRAEAIFEKGKEYMLFPCTFHAKKEAKYSLRFSLLTEHVSPATDVLQVKQCNHTWFSRAVKGEWRGSAAGGCRNHKETWLNNPQYCLRVATPCRVAILLLQMREDVSIGFYAIIRKSGSMSILKGPIKQADIVARSVFKADREATCQVDLNPGIYTLVPCTFEPNVEGPFVLNVYSDSPQIALSSAGVRNVPSAVTGSTIMSQSEAVQKRANNALANPRSSSYDQPSSPSASRVAKIQDTTKSVGQLSLSTEDLPKVSRRSSRSEPQSPRANLDVQWDEVEVLNKIGQGGFGIVYRGVYKGQDVAVKKVLHDEMDEDDVTSFHAEVEIMSKLRHKNIVKFLGASLTPPNICILTVFCEKGNLTAVLRNEPDLAWAVKIKMAMDACEGMIYLHSHTPPVCHRDLKSLNLLVDSSYNTYVADFGLSKVTSGFSLNSKVGSLNWCAPEILLKSSPYTTKGDVYSFGMILWELVTHTAPFFKMHPLQIVRAIDHGELPEIPPNTPEMYGALIKACWHTNPDRRPEFNIILEALSKFENGQGF